MSKIERGYYMPSAIILAIVVIAIAIWGAVSFAAVSGVIWEKGPQVWSWG